MRTNRRDFIRLSLAGGAAASTLGMGATLAGCGEDPPEPGRKWLRTADVEMLRALAPAVLEGAVGADDAASLALIVDGFDGLPEDLSPQVIAGVRQAFGLLQFGLTRGLLTGQWSGWHDASTSDAKAALAQLGDSDTELLNAIHRAVNRLIIAVWYGGAPGRASTHYPGPPKKRTEATP